MKEDTILEEAIASAEIADDMKNYLDSRTSEERAQDAKITSVTTVSEMNPITQLLKEREEEFVEQGAALEHERWARWQKYMFSKSFFPESASTVESMNLDSSPDGFPESKDFEEGIKVGWNSLRDKLRGCVIIPKEFSDRWFRQIEIPYSELSEQEKESDRKETRQYLPIQDETSRQLIEVIETMVEGMKYKIKRKTYKMDDGSITNIVQEDFYNKSLTVVSALLTEAKKNI